MNTSSMDVTVNDQLYRVIRMTPLAGARIVNVLFSAMAKISSPETDSKGAEEFEKLPSEEKANIALESMWVTAATIIPTDVYEDIQKTCLRCCQQYPENNPENPPVPIMMISGRWAVNVPPVTTVSKLIVKALQFNLAPFFIESTSKQAGAAALVSNP